MKILIANELGSIVGGREIYLSNVAHLLQAAGHEVRSAFEHPAAAEMPSVAHSAVWQLPGDFDSIRTWKPDVVFLHGLGDPALEGTIAARFPTAYFAHGYFGTCISGAKCHTHPSMKPCQRSLGLACLAAYLPRGCGGRNPVTMIRQYWRERRRGGNLARYRAVVVASRHMRTEFLNHGVPAERLHLAPLFPGDTSPDSAPPVDRPMTGRVLFIGRLTALKGGRLLIDALARARARLNRPLELIIAGEGPERADMESAALATNLPARFVGWVDPAQRTQLMREADVLAVPSLWPEPFGLVGIEAGCVSLPAAGFAVGGIPDWLEPGVSGESAGPHEMTADGLADALTRVLRDSKHWRRLRRGAWEVARRFSREAHIANLSAILQSCL